jgi:hypothetical protein
VGEKMTEMRGYPNQFFRPNWERAGRLGGNQWFFCRYISTISEILNNFRTTKKRLPDEGL